MVDDDSERYQPPSIARILEGWKGANVLYLPVYKACNGALPPIPDEIRRDGPLTCTSVATLVDWQKYFHAL